MVSSGFKLVHAGTTGGPGTTNTDRSFRPSPPPPLLVFASILSQPPLSAWTTLSAKGGGGDDEGEPLPAGASAMSQATPLVGPLRTEIVSKDCSRRFFGHRYRYSLGDPTLAATSATAELRPTKRAKHDDLPLPNHPTTTEGTTPVFTFKVDPTRVFMKLKWNHSLLEYVATWSSTSKILTMRMGTWTTMTTHPARTAGFPTSTIGNKRNQEKTMHEECC